MMAVADFYRMEKEVEETDGAETNEDVQVEAPQDE